MSTSFPTVLTFILLVFSCFLFTFVRSIPRLLGVHPLDEKYYASKVIKCRDGSKSFSRDRLNDDFCDCVDGTDEPGTSACPDGKFYCRNMGSTPKFIFSSRVNDHFCDCCDGSDEYGGTISCPNTCVMGGNVEYKSDKQSSTVSNLGNIDGGLKETSDGVKMGDLVQNLIGLKILIVLQVAVIFCIVVLRIIHRRMRSRNRRYRGSNTVVNISQL